MCFRKITEVWAIVATSFNLNCGPDEKTYSADEVPQIYEKILKLSAAKVGWNKKKIKDTGGGEFSSIPLSAAEDIILEMTDKTVLGLTQSEFDNDNEISQICFELEECEHFTKTCEVNDADDDIFAGEHY